MRQPDCAAIILAAGKGTRMHSARPKVLQAILGSPMLEYVKYALQPVFQDNIYIVVGFEAGLIKAAFPASNFIMQEKQLGTGHALNTAMPAVMNFTSILVVNGDSPAITTETICGFMERAAGSDIAFASIDVEDAAAYGRVMRKDGKLAGIVEAKEFANLEEVPKEINTGLYLFRTETVKKLLPELKCENRGGEYYITELVELGLAKNLDVRAIHCGHDENLLGVNSPLELIQVEEAIKKRINRSLQQNGVIIHSPQTACISPFASIEPGSEISGPCEIFGKTVIHKGARIHAFTSIKDCLIGQNAAIHSFSHLENAWVERDALIGPYARIRPHSVIGAGAHVGNFVELKKTSLGEKAKANHLSYLGDAEIGSNANIGAGTITCNYDGKNKHQTIIGENAFIGSNSALVAPVTVGSSALVGAGSVITCDVPENALALARGRQKNLPDRGMKKQK